MRSRALQPRRVILLTATKLAFGALLLVLVLRGLQWHQLRAGLGQVWWLPFGGTLAIRFLALAARAWRWSVLMGREGEGRQVGVLTRILVKAELFNNVMPSTAGGDVYRMLSTKPNGGGPFAAAAVLADRAAGMITLVSMAAGVVLVSPWVRGTGVGIAVAVVTALALGATAAAWLTRVRTRRWLQTVAERTDRPRRAAAFRQVLRYYRALEQYAERPRQLAAALALSLLPVAGVVASTYLLCLSVGASVPPLELTSVALTVTVVSLLPIFINGLGGMEAAFIVTFQHVGVAPHQALLIALLTRAVLVLTAVIGGLVYLYDSTVSHPARSAGAASPTVEADYPGSSR